MRPVGIILFFFMYLHIANAQKVVNKTIVNSTISFIQIDASNCFEITLETIDTNEMVIEATIDGEYENDLLSIVKEEGSTVLVNTGFQPNFRSPNDKLSAHKVVSIALKVKLPKDKNVNVYGSSCNVTATGVYERLKVSLNDGGCNLYNVYRFAEINTQSGDIHVRSAMATIDGKSKYGLVESDEIPTGNDYFKLNTITGNILLNRIE